MMRHGIYLQSRTIRYIANITHLLVIRLYYYLGMLAFPFGLLSLPLRHISQKVE